MTISLWYKREGNRSENETLISNDDCKHGGSASIFIQSAVSSVGGGVSTNGFNNIRVSYTNYSKGLTVNLLLISVNLLLIYMHTPSNVFFTKKGFNLFPGVIKRMASCSSDVWWWRSKILCWRRFEGFLGSKRFHSSCTMSTVDRIYVR